MKISADIFGNLALTLSAHLSFQSVKEFGLRTGYWEVRIGPDKTVSTNSNRTVQGKNIFEKASYNYGLTMRRGELMSS